MIPEGISVKAEKRTDLNKKITKGTTCCPLYA